MLFRCLGKALCSRSTASGAMRLPALSVRLPGSLRFAPSRKTQRLAAFFSAECFSAVLETARLKHLHFVSKPFHGFFTPACFSPLTHSRQAVSALLEKLCASGVPPPALCACRLCPFAYRASVFSLSRQSSAALLSRQHMFFSAVRADDYLIFIHRRDF